MEYGFLGMRFDLICGILEFEFTSYHEKHSCHFTPPPPPPPPLLPPYSAYSALSTRWPLRKNYIAILQLELADPGSKLKGFLLLLDVFKRL